MPKMSAMHPAAISTVKITGIRQPGIHPPRYLLPGGGGPKGARLRPNPPRGLIGGGLCPRPPKPPRGPDGLIC